MYISIPELLYDGIVAGVGALIGAAGGAAGAALNANFMSFLSKVGLYNYYYILLFINSGINGTCPIPVILGL